MIRSGKAIITVAALVVLVGACGSSSSKGSGGSSTPGVSNSSGSGSGSSGNTTLSDLIAKGKTANIKVVYKDDSGQSITVIQRGKDSVFGSGSSTLYTIGGKATSCSGTGSSATCTEMAGLGGLTGALGSSVLGVWTNVVDAAVKLPTFADVKTSNETIAGRDAKCVTLSAGLGGGKSGTICVDAQSGILLRVQSGGKSVFEATSVGTPSDSDFKLPAKPTTVTLPSGMTIPSISVPSTP